MAGSLERNGDGSLSLYINGDLQFDSKDEHIYHEGLVLPGLVLACGRATQNLKVLIIGGGDGLVARELFKSQRVTAVDLVDYDPEILNFARQEFANLNGASLSDPRLTIHVKDAWQYVDETTASYDLIVSDLTVPEDASGARFHSVDWYKKLGSLLTSGGILAVNAVSPLATPEAFFCVFNSILKGGLKPRPYHVHIPSFAAKGYGEDWGFFLASRKEITGAELKECAELPEPRYFLESVAHIQELFSLPQEIFACQKTSMPATSESEILLHYFANANVIKSAGEKQDALALDTDNMLVPNADAGKSILPPELSLALAETIYLDSQPKVTQPQEKAAHLEADQVLDQVLDLMPSLRRDHTPELVADFLQNPALFLEAVDLPDLVKGLLERAQELPARVVAELELLRDNLQDWAGDHLSLLSLGSRVLTVLTLVIIIGNLLYPDAVYGKGAGAGAHAAAHGHAGHAVGGRGGVYGNRGYGYGTNYTYYNRRPAINNVVTPGPVQHVPGNVQIKSYPSKGKNTSGFLPAGDRSPVALRLTRMVRDVEATRSRLTQERLDQMAYGDLLLAELNQYQSSTDDMVNFGSRRLSKNEAVRRNTVALARTNNRIAKLSEAIDQLPTLTALAQIAEAEIVGQEPGNLADDDS